MIGGDETESRVPGRFQVLIIDDDRKLCRLIGEYLGPLGYEVKAAHTGPEGIERAVGERWDAVILDVMLPGLDGFEALRRIRTKSQVPVLMLTARGDEPDRIVGLEMGADDYLPKNFSTRELLARLRAVIRRSHPAAKETDEAGAGEIVLGALRINESARIAAVEDRPVQLTPVEFELLLSLGRARGRVKTREQLLEEIRERDYEVFDRSIDVHIAALRKKLGDDAREPRFIRTIRAVGYMFIRPE